MNLYTVSIWAAICGVILLTCYLLIRLVVRTELKKSLPNQIKTAQAFFKSKDVMLTLRIKHDGEVIWDNFELVGETKYIQ